MKKAFVFLLALVMVFSLSVTAFAEVTQYPSVTSSGGLDGEVCGLEVYNAKDELIDFIPASKVLKLSVGQANALSKEEADAFLKAYEEAKSVTDKVVVYFYWLDVKDYKYPEDFCYIKYPFSCPGENVTFSVNGKPMEVVHVDGSKYFAKMTETGAIMICCDK
jgi:hypothetical protein